MNPHMEATNTYMSEGQAEMAQVEATLALAYEQRTANLLAQLALTDLNGGTDKQIKKAYELARQVEERLDLA